MKYRIEEQGSSVVLGDIQDGRWFEFLLHPGDIMRKVTSTMYFNERSTNTVNILSNGATIKSEVNILVPISVDLDGTIVFRRVNND